MNFLTWKKYAKPPSFAIIDATRNSNIGFYSQIQE
jgi:hypothetical protein